MALLSIITMSMVFSSLFNLSFLANKPTILLLASTLKAICDGIYINTRSIAGGDIMIVFLFLFYDNC